jgi:adenylosuccinate synthase
MKTDAVIGAIYGDEGKGRMVLDLATPESTVVRFNGSAQASHTGIWRGVRHAFSHFGSGTPKGAATVLSEHFVCNPMEFNGEYAELREKGYDPLIMVDPRCQVTTIYDAIINIMAERSRGDDRHGSVGVGFGETIERDEKGWGLTVSDLMYGGDQLRTKLKGIRDVWVPMRCAALGFDYKSPAIGGPFQKTLTSDDTIDAFVNECRLFIGRIAEATYGYDAEHIIFEGAQGLMLDMDYGVFPYVTRSYCGLRNIRELTDRELDVHYMSRAYTTRHGAGPLPHELPGKPYPAIEDKTNLWNESQEGLRFSYLNLDTLDYTINADIDKYGDDKMRYYGVLTCMDQVPDEAGIIINDKTLKVRKGELGELFSSLPFDDIDTRWSAETKELEYA